MKVIIVDTYQEISDKAFEIIKDIVVNKKDAVLGLATGSSPIGIYNNMIQDHKENKTDYSNVVTFNLDEYVDLPKEHKQSYYSFMNDNLFYGINVKKENIHIPTGVGVDLEKACLDYENNIGNYEIDVQILGIGSNGHIGFNEPNTPFDSTTHIVTLAEKTRLDNQRFFNDLSEVPTKAITMGIATIVKSKKIILVANGSKKKEAISRTIEGEIGLDCPATILQNHPDCTIIIDKEAASLLKNKYE